MPVGFTWNSNFDDDWDEKSEFPVNTGGDIAHPTDPYDDDW